jgi:hypothetical protein
MEDYTKAIHPIWKLGWKNTILGKQNQQKVIDLGLYSILTSLKLDRRQLIEKSILKLE